MKDFLEGFVIAFSMYSIIPMPMTDWKKENMKYALCWLPLIGLVVAAFLYLFYLFSIRYFLSPGLFASIAVFIPILITGGIHLDGFIDTADAICSRMPVEKKLIILKDPLVGAFGVIYCVIFLLLQFGLWQELYSRHSVGFVLFGFFLSRLFGAYSVVAISCSKHSGLAYMFQDGASKDTVKKICSWYFIISALLFFFIYGFWGTVLILCSVLAFFIFSKFCYKNFEGITGDLAGFFIQLLELLFLIIGVLRSVFIL